MAYVNTSKKSSTPSGEWEELGVRAASTVLTRGIFCDIIGGEGQGKSSVALTAPGKIAYLDIDQSVDRAHKPDGKKALIHPVRYQINIGDSKQAIVDRCNAVWTAMEKKALEAAASWAGSVVLDTGTEGWELRRFASVGELNPKGRRMDRVYGPINAIFRQFLRRVYRDQKKHLVTIHQTYDEYIDVVDKQSGEMTSKRTGKKVPKGFKEIAYMADVTLRAFRDPEDKKFKVEVVTCKLPPNGPDIEGSVFEDELASFAGVISTATDTDFEQWL